MDECNTWDNGSVWHKDWPHRINAVHWSIFHSHVILPYISLKLFDGGISYSGIMDSVNDWPHKIYVGQWPIFHSLVILFNILKNICWMNVLLGATDQCVTKTDLICRTFCSPMILLNILKTIWCMNIIFGFVDQRHRDWSHKVYIGQCPTFSFYFFCPVILPYICKVNVIDLNHFNTLHDGAGQVYSCPSRHLLDPLKP